MVLHCPTLTMRVLDMVGMKIVHQGAAWPYEGVDPCAKDMLAFLERNESLISWVQPESDEGVSGQVPVIRVGDKYCTLSLRMMKSVWRHVRLKKEFVNQEPLPQGGSKLRIPNILLLEKIRTQTRFNVSPHSPFPTVTPPCSTRVSLACNRQTMRMKGDQRKRDSSASAQAPPSPPQTSKEPSLLCRRVTEAMDNIIMPIGKGTVECPESTSFVFTEADYVAGLVRSIATECPALAKTRCAFSRALLLVRARRAIKAPEMYLSGKRALSEAPVESA